VKEIMMTIAIVGGGLAGVTVASELRKLGYEGRIVIYAAEPHLPYERPPLSKDVLLGKKDVESAYLHEADWYRDNDIEVQSGTDVTSLNTEAHTLETSAGIQSYTTLVLATGASARRLSWVDELDHSVYYLRTISDSVKLRTALLAKPNVAVIGAGWIGLEVAAAARELGCEVTVFESAELPLLAVLGPEVAQSFAVLHRGHGVNLRLGVKTTANDLLPFDLVVVGIGAQPNVGLAESGGLTIDNGVLVDEYLKTSDPDVYAIGDIANQDHPVLGRGIRVEHWDNAIEQGKAAARNIVGANEAYERLPYFFSDQYDLGMEYVGNVGPDGYDEVVIEGDLAGAFQAFWLRDSTIVAAMHANDWDASDKVRASVGKRR